MQQYQYLMRHVLENGHDKSDRTGTGTRSVFGWQMRFDLAAGFPMVTTKKLHLKSIVLKIGSARAIAGNRFQPNLVRHACPVMNLEWITS